MIPAPTPRTVIEAVVPRHEEVSIAVVLDLAGAAGIGAQAVRLTVRRMITAGQVVQTGRGRAASLRLTEAGRAELDTDRLAIALALAQDDGRAPWDGVWHLVALSVPESQRTVRDALRRRLLDLGAAAVSTGLYASPHDLVPMLGTQQRSLLVSAAAATLDVRGTSEPRELVELLWPAAQVFEPYRELQRLVGECARDLHAASDGGAPQVIQLRLAEGLEWAIRGDPLVPVELRAQPWLPSAVRHELRKVWRAAEVRHSERTLFPGWL